MITSPEVLMGAALGIFDPSTYAQMYVEAFHGTSKANLMLYFSSSAGKVQ